MSLVVRKFPSREALGQGAARDVAAAIRGRLETAGLVRIIFACAPSQESTLRALAAEPGIDWPRVVAFHMDEYIGLSSDAPQRFGAWLRRTLLDHVPCGDARFIEPEPDPDRAAREYGEHLAAAPIDIVCLGIGVNGHLAFNDPPADLADPSPARVVALSIESRRQQVSDGCFETLDAVPTRAITLTVPRLLAADEVFAMVPGRDKRDAVARALRDPVSGDHPATALRAHSRCTLYLDAGSAPDAPDGPTTR